MSRVIPLSSPEIDQSDIDSVGAVLRSGRLSLGPAGPEFEKAVADYTGARHAVAVSSGTAGLHLAVLGLGLQPGDEVITTPFSFVASTNSLLFAGLRPVFVDIHPETWDLQADSVLAAAGPRTRAVLPVHVFGRPLPIAPLVEGARRAGLLVIEDACESLGSTGGGGKMTGTFGDAGVYAFYPNKQMTTGEGGMLVTADERLASVCRSLRNQGRGADTVGPEHERLGYNYRLSDIHSALGLSQIRRIDSFIASRQRVFDFYREALAELPGVRLPAPTRPGERVSWFVFVIRLEDNLERRQRDDVIAGLRRRGVDCRAYFQPIHLQPHVRECTGTRPGQFPVTERIADRTISLPFHNRLTEAEVDHVAKALRASLQDAVAT